MSSFLAIKRDLPTTLKVVSAIAVGALAARWLLSNEEEEESTLPLTREGLRDYSKVIDTSSQLKYKVERLADGSTTSVGYSRDPDAERPRYDESKGPHFDVSPLGGRTIVKSEKGLGAEPAMTVVELFRAAVKRHGPHTALISAEGVKYTWQQYHDTAFDLAKALVSFGLKKGDSVNIIGFNSPEWYVRLFCFVLIAVAFVCVAEYSYACIALYVNDDDVEAHARCTDSLETEREGNKQATWA
jgi:hypothetical protein